MASRIDVRALRPFLLACFVAALVITPSASAAAPVSTVAPAITGVPRVLSPVTCSQGTWDQAATFTYAWLVDGTPVDGASTATFTLRGIDRGHSVTCQVTATTPEPAATTVSSTAIVPLPALQTITGGFQLSTGRARSCGTALVRACTDRRRSGGTIRVGGVLTPARSGAKVVVLYERQRDNHWVLSMTRTARVAADGSYFVAVPSLFFAATTWRIRTRVPETDVYAAAASQLRFDRVVR